MSYERNKAANFVASTDPRVQAIRSDPNVGRGSCTTIDECWEPREILEFLLDNKIKTPKEAVSWAYAQEGFHREMGTNCSSGEPDCHLIASYNEWQEVVKKHLAKK